MSSFSAVFIDLCLCRLNSKTLCTDFLYSLVLFVIQFVALNLSNWLMINSKLLKNITLLLTHIS